MSGCVKDDGCDLDCNDCIQMHCDECDEGYPIKWRWGQCACGGNIVADDTNERPRHGPHDEHRLTIRDVI